MDYATENIQYEIGALSNEDLERLLQELGPEEGVQMPLDASQYSGADDLLKGTLEQQPPTINNGSQLNINAPSTGQNFVNPQQLHQISTYGETPLYPNGDHGASRQRSDRPHDLPSSMHQSEAKPISPSRPYDQRTFQQPASSKQGADATSQRLPLDNSVQRTPSGASGSGTDMSIQASQTLPSTFFGVRHQRLSQAGAYTNIRPETFFMGELQPYSPLYLSLMPGGSCYEKLITWCHTWASAIGVDCGPNHPWRVVDVDIIVEEIRLMHRPTFKHPFRRDWNAHLLPASQNPSSGTAKPAPTAVMVPSTARSTIDRFAAPTTTFPGGPSTLRLLEGSEVQRQAGTPATPTLVSSDRPNQQTSAPEEAQPKTPSPPKNVKMPRPPVKDVRKMAEERYQKLQECRRDNTGAKLWEHAKFGVRDLEQNGVRSVRKIVGDPDRVPLEMPFDYAAHEEVQRQAIIDQQAQEAQQIHQQQRQPPSKKRGYQEDAGNIAAEQRRQKRSRKGSSAVDKGAVRMSRAPSGTSQTSAHIDLTTPPPRSRVPDPASLSRSASGWPGDLPRMPLDVYGVQSVKLETLNRSIDSPDLPTVAKLFKNPVDPAAREIIETLWYVQEHVRRENDNGRLGPVTIRESAKRLIDFFDNHKTHETTQGADLSQTASHVETNGSRFGSVAPPPHVVSSKSTHTLSSNAPKAGEIESSSSGQSRQKPVPRSGSSKGQRKEQVLPPRRQPAMQPVGTLPAYANQTTPMSRKRSAEAMESSTKRTKADDRLASERIATRDFAVNPTSTDQTSEAPAPTPAPAAAAAGINNGAAVTSQQESLKGTPANPPIDPAIIHQTAEASTSTPLVPKPATHTDGISNGASEEPQQPIQDQDAPASEDQVEDDTGFDALGAELSKYMAESPGDNSARMLDNPVGNEPDGEEDVDDFDDLFDERPGEDAGAEQDFEQM